MSVWKGPSVHGSSSPEAEKYGTTPCLPLGSYRGLCGKVEVGDGSTIFLSSFYQQDNPTEQGHDSCVGAAGRHPSKSVTPSVTLPENQRGQETPETVDGTGPLPRICAVGGLNTMLLAWRANNRIWRNPLRWTLAKFPSHRELGVGRFPHGMEQAWLESTVYQGH